MLFVVVCCCCCYCHGRDGRLTRGTLLLRWHIQPTARVQEASAEMGDVHDVQIFLAQSGFSLAQGVTGAPKRGIRAESRACAPAPRAAMAPWVRNTGQEAKEREKASARKRTGHARPGWDAEATQTDRNVNTKGQKGKAHTAVEQLSASPATSAGHAAASAGAWPLRGCVERRVSATGCGGGAAAGKLEAAAMIDRRLFYFPPPPPPPPSSPPHTPPVPLISVICVCVALLQALLPPW